MKSRSVIRFMFGMAVLGSYILAIIPTNKILEKVTIWDKFNHFAAFSTLAVLFLLSDFKLSKISVFGILVFYGFFIEITQYMLPYRFFCLYDVLADIIGIFIGFGLYFLMGSYFPHFCRK